jgi:hypothetical protein
MSFLRYYVWVAPHIVLGFVLLASLKKRLHKELPVFCVCIAFEILRFALLFAVSRLVTNLSIGVYLWFLTCTAAIDAALQLSVVYELTQNLIFSRTSMARILRPMFMWTVAGLVLVAAATSGSLRDISREKVGNGFEILDFSFGLVEVGILVALFLFSRVLRISWRSRATGVALGFGVSACIELGTAALRAGLGRSAFIALDITQMSAFHVSVVIWLVYLLLPDQAPAFAGRGFEKSDIQMWDQELQRMTER